mmetsp:Transcript_9823/g.31218  ORF Transcript_9823/g.31218 Transcript_9823/m.31218 type:complete len:214 (+) Transcript_9823:242-883(+)
MAASLRRGDRGLGLGLRGRRKPRLLWGKLRLRLHLRLRLRRHGQRAFEERLVGRQRALAELGKASLGDLARGGGLLDLRRPQLQGLGGLAPGRQRLLLRRPGGLRHRLGLLLGGLGPLDLGARLRHFRLQLLLGGLSGHDRILQCRRALLELCLYLLQDEAVKAPRSPGALAAARGADSKSILSKDKSFPMRIMAIMPGCTFEGSAVPSLMGR